MLTISKTESTAVPTLFKPGYNQINSSVQHLFRGAFLFAKKHISTIAIIFYWRPLPF